MPPSDTLLNLIFSKTQNVMLIQPPFINTDEFNELPAHECEYLFWIISMNYFVFTLVVWLNV